MKPEQTEKQKKVAKYAKIAAAIGFVLAIVCQFVPPKFQAACNLVAQVAPHACS